MSEVGLGPDLCPGRMQLLLHAEDIVLGRLKSCIEASDYTHGQDNITVFAPDADIPKPIVGDTPY